MYCRSDSISTRVTAMEIFWMRLVNLKWQLVSVFLGIFVFCALGACKKTRPTPKRRVDSRCDTRENSGCKQFGWCSWNGKSCVATDDERCRQSLNCKKRGDCSRRGDICVVARDEDCQQTALCSDRGWCSASKRNCVAGKDADCRKSKACLVHKRCVARDGKCVKG